MHNINFIRENPTEFDNYMKQIRPILIQKNQTVM